MELLTEKGTDSFGITRAVLREPSKNSACTNCKHKPNCDDCSLQKAVNFINEIEQIIGDDYDLARLLELVTADKEGRCVVKPCKDGDAVWRIYDDCEFPGDCHTKQKCSGCEYRNIFVEEQAFCLSMLSPNGKLEPPYYLTLQAAEAALAEKGERDG